MRTGSGACLALLAGSAAALELDVTSPASIKNAAKQIANEMVTTFYRSADGQYYSQPGGIPGLLPQPYYWWSAGAMMGTLLDYRYYTGDTGYDSMITEAMLYQTGPRNDYMPPNQTKSLGNDDQAFWGLAAMSAAEQNFPNPPSDRPQWLALAQAVYNTQVVRWNTFQCGGGLKWQVFTFNQGYDYRNSISNGCFFNLASRLSMYTGNTTYAEWAEKTWDWSRRVGLVNETAGWMVYDGTSDSQNCTGMNHMQWTYNVGVYLLGTATLWNITTGSSRAKWETATRGLLTGMEVFFKDDVMIEAACEPAGNCNKDQESFKAYLSRWIAASIKVAPWVEPIVQQKLVKSAQGAAKSCTGGNGALCGMRWTAAYDGFKGVGWQMNALEVIQGLLIDSVPGPVSANSGGTSKGDPTAGTEDAYGDRGEKPKDITTADRAGAGILTAIVLITTVTGAWFLLM